MTCPNCSINCEEGAAVCSNCGQPLPLTPENATGMPPVKDYLILNIILLSVTCLCVGCTPAFATGILGVVFSAQARSLFAEGKPVEAKKKAKTAKYLAIATGSLIVLTVLFLIAYFVIFFGFYGAAFGAMMNEIPKPFGLLVR